MLQRRAGACSCCRTGLKPARRAWRRSSEAGVTMPVSDRRTLSIERAPLVEWYLRNRERSRRLFDLIDPEVYYTRPIALRNPIVFYEGHLPGFSVISFLKRGVGHPRVEP